ncbi:hypothetical protein JVT61DRAFT_1789 [Boletus reticuloceps]|uniref:Uncharacterized protein n=1 Tax=Boletus reticuloceps TaxID=495285 RepID=A0A8I2YRY7_9AGAM|nr:hypothetical protein JVT61DRAFT_1789 [Boletus reticuloceps]
MRVHHQQNKLNDSVTLRYQKVQSDEAGSLSLKKKTIRIRKDPETKPNKTSTTAKPSDIVIPEVMDNLPASVDLSILDNAPRPRTASVNFTWHCRCWIVA